MNKQLLAEVIASKIDAVTRDANIHLGYLESSIETISKNEDGSLHISLTDEFFYAYNQDIPIHYDITVYEITEYLFKELLECRSEINYLRNQLYEL